MPVLREHHLRAFEAQARRAFEDRLAAHLRRFFPEASESLGEEGLRDLCRDGVERARGHGFETEQDLCKYLNLMLTFGAEFDREQAWAAGLLASPGPAPARMELLCAEALDRAGEGRGILDG